LGAEGGYFFFESSSSCVVVLVLGFIPVVFYTCPQIRGHSTPTPKTEDEDENDDEDDWGNRKCSAGDKTYQAR
jgi:hypothetical protein